MRRLILIPLLFFCLTAIGQNIETEVSNAICKCITEYSALKDSSLLKYCYILGATETKGLPKSSKKIEKILQQCHFELQKICPAYVDLTRRLIPMQGDWRNIADTSINTFDTSVCTIFSKYTDFYYLEHTGDTTRLSIKDGFWTDFFTAKNTYSKCSFQWTDKCNFELEFIKSNDPLRKNMSKKGDKYKYRLLSSTPTYFLLLVHYGNVWQEFKLYY